ncbi:MAG: response regulator transcription factor [Acidobacteria bacterium]|nr:response regulator transcription factor [Acidobacteriota bacterium]MCI0663850.1 response regulator transcription factor [Acidobacteriota bacterium]
MRVLVIEDEQKMADLIKRGLEEEGMEVETVYDGETGLEAGKDGKHDLIILDLGLPGRDGLDISRELRSTGVKTPILILTAQDSTEMKVRGLDSGADDYLTKPFAFAEMLARIRALQRRTLSEDSTKLQIGDLSLNLINRRVNRANVEVQLTGKEFALLEFFMRHPDEILSRETLSEKVWEETFDTLTNVIDVYINYLRNKIDRQFEPKLIHTVRGVGYMFKTPTADSRLLAETKAS